MDLLYKLYLWSNITKCSWERMFSYRRKRKIGVRLILVWGLYFYFYLAIAAIFSSHIYLYKERRIHYTNIIYPSFQVSFFDKVFPDVRYFFTIVPISYVHIGRSKVGKCFISSSIISSPSLSKCFSNYVDYSHTTTTYMAAKKIQQTQYFFCSPFIFSVCFVYVKVQNCMHVWLSFPMGICMEL